MCWLLCVVGVCGVCGVRDCAVMLVGLLWWFVDVCGFVCCWWSGRGGARGFVRVCWLLGSALVCVATCSD